MDAELILSYENDDEYRGELFATVRSGRFAGWGSDWFDRLQLKERFIARLRAFPLDPSALPSIDGGLIESQRNLSIVISPYDSRGTILVRVDTASESHQSADEDLQQRLTVRFLTDYSSVAEFADQLGKVMDGSATEAIIKGFSR